jgi:hypothetical protein
MRVSNPHYNKIILYPVVDFPGFFREEAALKRHASFTPPF